MAIRTLSVALLACMASAAWGSGQKLPFGTTEECQRQGPSAFRTPPAIAQTSRALLAKYPNEASHAQARATALDRVRKAEERASSPDRKVVTMSPDPYPGKVAPLAVKAPNEAGEDARKALFKAQTDDINRQFDAELAQLRHLWAGGRPIPLAATVVCPLPR